MQRSHGSISAKILFAVAVGALGSSLVACQGQSIGMDQGDSGVANDATTNRGDATPTDANVPFDAPVDATLACTGNQMTRTTAASVEPCALLAMFARWENARSVATEGRRCAGRRASTSRTTRKTAAYAGRRVRAARFVRKERAHSPA
jgi:hypothetical protein